MANSSDIFYEFEYKKSCPVPSLSKMGVMGIVTGDTPITNRDDIAGLVTDYGIKFREEMYPKMTKEQYFAELRAAGVPEEDMWQAEQSYISYSAAYDHWAEVEIAKFEDECYENYTNYIKEHPEAAPKVEEKEEAQQPPPEDPLTTADAKNTENVNVNDIMSDPNVKGVTEVIENPDGSVEVHNHVKIETQEDVDKARKMVDEDIKGADEQIKKKKEEIKNCKDKEKKKQLEEELEKLEENKKELQKSKSELDDIEKGIKLKKDREEAEKDQRELYGSADDENNLNENNDAEKDNEIGGVDNEFVYDGMQGRSQKDSGDSIDLQDRLSYLRILQDRRRFIQAGGNFTSGENVFDVPNHTFFKLVFHFLNGTSDTPIVGEQGKNQINSGLLGPSWFAFEGSSAAPAHKWSADNIPKLHGHPTAWAYLKMNGEDIRAANLRRFIELLSNINSYSPWYFQKLKGLESALERKCGSGEMDFQITGEQMQIQIECLEDSVDARIGSLVDLYRTVVWDWQSKRIMLPDNLRKFDMSIIVYNEPIVGLDIPSEVTYRKPERGYQPTLRNDMNSGAVGQADNWQVDSSVSNKFASMSQSANPMTQHIGSYKIFELTGCQFDYNQGKSGWGELNNVDGNNQTYTLTIGFDDIMEVRYNEFMNYEISEFLRMDNWLSIYNEDTLLAKTSKVDREVYSNYMYARNTDNLVEQLSQTSTSMEITTDEAMGRVYDVSDTGVDSIMQQGSGRGQLAQIGLDEKLSTLVSPILNQYYSPDGTTNSSGQFGNKLINTINNKVSGVLDPLKRGVENFSINNYVNNFVKDAENDLNRRLTKSLNRFDQKHGITENAAKYGEFLEGNYRVLSDPYDRSEHRLGSDMTKDVAPLSEQLKGRELVGTDITRDESPLGLQLSGRESVGNKIMDENYPSPFTGNRPGASLGDFRGEVTVESPFGGGPNTRVDITNDERPLGPQTSSRQSVGNNIFAVTGSIEMAIMNGRNRASTIKNTII